MGLRKYGKQLPSPANPMAQICFKIVMPDALQYRAAILGQISFLALWFAWTHVNDGIIPEDNEIAANLWAQAMGTYTFEECMEICEQIIECIVSDADTQQAIVDMLKDNPSFNQYFTQNVYRITSGQIAGKLVGGDCDKSVVAGRAIALVERLDANNKDMLEAVVAGTNDEELAGIIIGAIPGLGEAPVDEILAVGVKFIENFAENYNSISNEMRKDDMAREIYCLMRETEDCSITFEQLFAYFQDKATSGLNIISTIIDVIQFLLDGDFDSDDQIWFGMFALQIGFVLNSRDFYGINAVNLGTIMRDAGTSTAWEGWDECPEEWCKYIDLRTTDGTSLGLTPTVEEDPTYTGERVSGQGFRGTQSPDLDRNFWSWQLPATAHVTKMEFGWSVPAALPAHTYMGPSGILTNIAAISEGVNERSFDTDTDTDYVVGGLEHSGFNLEFVAFVQWVRVSGTGPNPFDSSNC